MPLSDSQVIAVDRYSHDGEFSEPLVRCDSCAKLIFSKQLTKRGMCECGNTRVRNVRSLTGEELETAKKWVKQGKLDKVWIDLWVESE